MSVMKNLSRRVNLNEIIDYALYILSMLISKNNISENEKNIPEYKFREIIIKTIDELAKKGYLVEDDFNSSLISEKYMDIIDDYRTFELITLGTSPNPGYYIKVNSDVFNSFFRRLYKKEDKILFETVKKIIEEYLLKKKKDLLY